MTNNNPHVGNNVQRWNTTCAKSSVRLRGERNRHHHRQDRPVNPAASAFVYADEDAAKKPARFDKPHFRGRRHCGVVVPDRGQLSCRDFKSSVADLNTDRSLLGAAAVTAALWLL